MPAEGNRPNAGQVALVTSRNPVKVKAAQAALQRCLLNQQFAVQGALPNPLPAFVFLPTAIPTAVAPGLRQRHWLETQVSTVALEYVINLLEMKKHCKGKAAGLIKGKSQVPPASYPLSRNQFWASHSLCHSAGNFQP